MGSESALLKRYKYTTYLFLLLSSALFAQDLDRPIRVDGKNQWQKELDIQGLQEGTHNLLITGTDKAGNVFNAPAIDIRIDPDSDLPIAGITYPSENLSINGDLTVLGSAKDDDAVEYVEVSLGDDIWQKAEGSDFWSLTISTADMADGEYTLSARAVDINGIPGREYKHSFYLNRSIPLIDFSSHNNGDLVSGKISIDGTVIDSNGIAMVTYSLDEGNSWLNAKLSNEARKGEGTFSLKINTQDLADGPKVLSFIAEDQLGGQAANALLLYIDNTPPELELVYPRENEPENSEFLISGKVTDKVGIDYLRWAYSGEEPQEIALEPGSSSWSVPVNLSHAKKMDIYFEFADLSGNSRTVKVRRELDLEGDRPRIELLEPLAEGKYGQLFMKGWIIDDDAPGGIIYRIDKGEEQRLEKGRTFSVQPKGIAPGEHRLTMRAFDLYGTEGEDQFVTFYINPENPEIEINQILPLPSSEENGASPIPYTEGLAVRTDRHSGISGSVTFDSGKGSAFYTLPGGDKRELKLRKDEEAGRFSFVIDFPPSMPFGFVSIEIQAEDDLGSIAAKSAMIWVQNLGIGPEAFGIFPAVQSETVLSKGEKIVLRYQGHSLKEFSLTGEPDLNTEIRKDDRGALILIGANQPGVYSSLTAQGLSDRGTDFSATLPDIIADFDPPIISIEGAESDKLTSAAALSGSVEDDSELDNLAYQIFGGESPGKRIPLSIKKESEVKGSFSLNLPVTDIPSGGGLVQIIITDRAGQGRSAYRTYLAPYSNEEVKAGLKGFVGGAQTAAAPDAVPAVLPGDLLEGQKLYVSAAASSLDGLTEIRYSLNDGKAELLKGSGEVREGFISPVPPGSHIIEFTALYGEGKTISTRLKFTVAEKASEISSSFQNGTDISYSDLAELIFTLDGNMAISSAEYRLDGGEPVAPKLRKEEKGEFLSLDLSHVDHGLHRLLLTVYDIHGRRVKKEFLFFAASDMEGRRVNDENRLYLLVNEPGNTLFYFNGRSIKEAEFVEQNDFFRLEIDGPRIQLSGKKPGIIPESRIRIITEDNEEFLSEPIELISDLEAPVLFLASPASGSYHASSMMIEGSATDDVSLESLQYSINGSGFRPLISEISEGQSPQSGDEETVSDGTDGSFRMNIDLSDLKEGPTELVVQAVDSSGNSSEESCLFIIDRTPADLIQILPTPEEPVNGAVPLIFRSRDEWAEELQAELLIDDKKIPAVSTNGFFSVLADLAVFEQIPEQFSLRVIDSAGNISEIKPQLNYIPASDKPVVSIQIPEVNALFEKAPTFSGTVLDDDGVAGIRYRVDEEEFQEINGGNSFEITIPFNQLSDNEHSLEVIAFDLKGVESEPFLLPFRVSKKVPEAEMTSPELSVTSSGTFLLEGTASDVNGIKAVYISLDNGNSYHLARGTENWVYSLDSRILVDQTYMVLIQAEDSYGVKSLKSSLITVDNTPPQVELSRPFDGMVVSDSIPLEMRVKDEVKLKEIRYELYNLDKPEKVKTGSIELPESEVVLHQINLEDLEEGLYNLTLYAVDGGNNEAIETVNVTRLIEKTEPAVDILYPLTGSKICGEFTIDGIATGSDLPGEVRILGGTNLLGTAKPDARGYFSLSLEPEALEDGVSLLRAEFTHSEGGVIRSKEVSIDYTSEGAWISISEFPSGSFASERPWIRGKTGYFAVPDPGEDEPSKQTQKNRKLVKLEYSLDKGKIFTQFKAGEEWKFRLETQDLRDGQIDITVRATYADGSVALDQVFGFVDDKAPTIRVLSPQEDLAFNDRILVSGTGFDESGISDITVTIRKGSKNGYEIPQFAQGMYIDFHALGATWWETGLGLTFFDQNVKLQFLVGGAPPGRFNGTVLGLKLLSNVATLPYSYFFGPDLSFLSSSLSVGAAFEYFSMTETEDQDGLVLGAILVQLELAKIELENRKMFNAFSFYLENQFWFISSDVQGGIEYRIGFGIRTNLF